MDETEQKIEEAADQIMEGVAEHELCSTRQPKRVTLDLYQAIRDRCETWIELLETEIAADEAE